MNREVLRYQRRLDNLFDRIAALSGDPELQAQWARYLCILVSGYLEVSIRAIFSEYARNRANKEVARYVDRQLNYLPSPKMEKIYQLIGLFSPDWESNIRTKIEKAQLKDSIDSIVANRNRIAHGEDVGITYIRIKNYYQDAIKVVELIHDQCNHTTF